MSRHCTILKMTPEKNKNYEIQLKAKINKKKNDCPPIPVNNKFGFLETFFFMNMKSKKKEKK